MEATEPSSTNDKDLFNPIPRLKSSPIPILFIPFNNNEDKCSHCGNEYFMTILFEQKYCKNCLYWFIKYVADDKYIDVHIKTNTKCIEHETIRNADFCTRNIQEWCQYCSEISYFKQIVPDTTLVYLPKMNDKQIKIIDGEKDCKVCGIMVYQQISPMYSQDFRLCSDCYRLSSGLAASKTSSGVMDSTKKSIPILYLPWWDPYVKCRICLSELEFISDCHKWCSNCLINYTGCRYCLTTNIIFGITDQSTCAKCKRSITIDIEKISNGNDDMDKFLETTRFNENDYAKMVHRISKTKYDRDANPLHIYNFINSEFRYIHFLKQPINNIFY